MTSQVGKVRHFAGAGSKSRTHFGPRLGSGGAGFGRRLIRVEASRMDSESPPDCFVCTKHALGDTAQGGVIFEDELVYAGHLPNRCWRIGVTSSPSL